MVQWIAEEQKETQTALLPVILYRTKLGSQLPFLLGINSAFMMHNDQVLIPYSVNTPGKTLIQEQYFQKA